MTEKYNVGKEIRKRLVTFGLMGILAGGGLIVGYGAGSHYTESRLSKEHNKRLEGMTKEMYEVSAQRIKNIILTNKLNIQEYQALQEGETDAVKKTLGLRISMNIKLLKDLRNGSIYKNIKDENIKSELETHIEDASRILE